MIGRLGIPTSISGQSSSNSGSSAPSGRGSITGSSGGMMSIGTSSLSGLSTGISKFSNMTKMVTETLVSSSADGEKKAKDEKKAQLALAVQMLEDISLQSPSTHLGLVLAYTGRNSSPVIHPGLKFTWFRMQGQDHIDQVEESQRAWYAPSVDDINCTICVQCEDNFGQGLSRYLECGPLQSDPLLRSAAESSINSGFFETKGVCVSFGLAEGDAGSSSSSNVVIDGSTVPVIAPVDPHTLHTTLSKENAFLQLNGRCTVEVDEQGIFISIPTFHAPSRLSNHSAHRDGDKTAFNTSRRGLRLPISTHMKVHCAAPSSLVLSVPLMQQQGATAAAAGDTSDPLSPTGDDDGVSSTSSSPTKASRQDGADAIDGSRESVTKAARDDEAMQQFLSSSILAIPWTYEGHNLSPEAYISGLGNKLSPEDREKLLKEAEEDSMIFAQTVVALAEFIASVPEGSKELLLCFSCADRLTRDTLVLSMRALACKPSNTSRYERRRTLPWVQWEENDGKAPGTGAAGVGQGSSATANGTTPEASEHEWKRRLKVVEEEAAALKRERNELTKQLLETKEELSLTKTKFAKAVKLGTGTLSATHSDVALVASGDALPLTQRSAYSEGDDMVSVHSQGGETATVDETADVFAMTDARQLQQKLIEVENKLAMSTKREQEVTRQREELETQNTKLSAELDTTKRKKDDAREKLSTLQRLYDQQGMLMRKVEDEADALRAKIATVAEKDTKMAQLEEQLAQLLTRQRQQDEELQALRTSAHEQQVREAAQTQQLQALETEHAVKLQVVQSNVAHVEQQLSSAMIDNKRLEREVLQRQETITRQEEALRHVKALEGQLMDAKKHNDGLQAEINHLQKKSESLSKDLKRVMKENAQSLSEFEKALIRKSGECDELYFQLLELREMENARMQAAASEDSAGAAILAKISSVLSTVQSKPSINASSTHSTNSNGTEGSSGTGGASAGPQLSSRVTTMFRRMSASAASLAANVTGSSSTDDAFASS